jgi:hypothetical protein
LSTQKGCGGQLDGQRHPSSRRRQISPTAAALSSLRAKSGRTWRARSANSSIASSASDSDGTRQLTSPATPIASRLVATLDVYTDLFDADLDNVANNLDAAIRSAAYPPGTGNDKS